MLTAQPLTYLWALTARPVGSTAALSDNTAVMPALVPDLPGTYVAQLIVNDGTLDSDADTVTITTAAPSNRAPVANAGPDATVPLAAIVQLDGGGSSDPDGDGLSYRWSLVTRPAGSAAQLTATDIAAPTFVADRAGTYVAQLIVRDGQVDSAPDTVTISTGNSMPVALAGVDQTVARQSTVQLDGGGSSDADGGVLLYSWSLLSRPAGSTATLSNLTIVNPTFVADLDGVYVAQLTVSDGSLVSAPDTVAITAGPGADLSDHDAGGSLHAVTGKPESAGTSDVENLGPFAAEQVTVHAPVPAGYTLIGFDTSGNGIWDPATGIWTIGTVAACDLEATGD